MIKKVDFSTVGATSVLNQNAAPQKASASFVRNDSEVMSKQSAEAAKLAFCGGAKINMSGKEAGIKLNDFINSDDIITLNDDKTKDKFYFKKTDGGYEITKEFKKDGETKTETIFRAKYEDVKDLPEISFKMGKYRPEITIHDNSLDGGRIQMFEGSEIKAEKFALTMPGISKGYGLDENHNKRQDISFKGKTVVTTLNLEDRTKSAVDKYVTSGLADKAPEGDYADLMAKHDPIITIPAGGFGTRFENMTEEDGENKPSFRLPTDDNYRVMATALNLGAMAGLTGKKGNEIHYVSQASDSHALKEGENVTKVDRYKTDGGAIAEAMQKDVIPEDKDVIVVNADIITNADITRTYKALKTLPNAALVIPYYPVDAKRAQSFGLMGLEKDENGNMQIKDFIEKPPHTDEKPAPNSFKTSDKYNTYQKVLNAWKAANERAKLPDGKHYYGNPGIYLMSKEAAQVLKKMGIENSDKTGLGADVMPKIVEMCQNGEIKNDKGESMRVYTVPLERKGGELAFWDDIGSAEAYLDTIKKIAVETEAKSTGEDNYYYGIPEFAMNDFNNNYDKDSHVLYMSDKSRNNVEDFKKQYGVSEFKGNIFAV